MNVSDEVRERLFGEAVARDLGGLRRLAASYERDPGLAEDLVQDILFAFWEALARFQGQASSRTYLFRIAQNCALRHIGRQRARKHVQTQSDEHIDTAVDRQHSPEHLALELDQRHQLERAVADLPDSLRQVVVLRLEGLSVKEIGEVFDLTPNNVTVRLHRARKKLRLQLVTRGSPKHNCGASRHD